MDRHSDSAVVSTPPFVAERLALIERLGAGLRCHQSNHRHRVAGSNINETVVD